MTVYACLRLSDDIALSVQVRESNTDYQKGEPCKNDCANLDHAGIVHDIQGNV